MIDLKKHIEQKRKINPLGLMTHMVAGYPSFEVNLQLAKKMEQCGTELIEIQLPFSDPLADGAVIMRANQKALEQGAKIKDCFDMIKKMSQLVCVPIIIMTYYNIPFHMGLKKYFEHCVKSGASGIIVPDIPFDEKSENFYQEISHFELQAIPVFSPTMNENRIAEAIKYFSETLKEKWSMLYSTLRVGATGEKNDIEQSGIDFLIKLKKKTALPIAAGFGLSQPQQLKQLFHQAEVAVIGSHLIRLMEKNGLNAVEDFLKECQKWIQT